MIQIEHLNKTYESIHGEAHVALKDINLTIEDGSIFGIIGQSGAGKSTLVRCINLLERPTSGNIIIDGRDVTNLSGKELLEFRSSVGMISKTLVCFSSAAFFVMSCFLLSFERKTRKKQKSARVSCLNW